MNNEEKIILLRELYKDLEKELRIIKEERKRYSLMSYKGQQISAKIPGILIAQTHINRKIREMIK